MGMAMVLAMIPPMPMMVCKTLSNSHETLLYISMASLEYIEQLLEMVSLSVNIVLLIGSSSIIS